MTKEKELAPCKQMYVVINKEGKPTGLVGESKEYLEGWMEAAYSRDMAGEVIFENDEELADAVKKDGFKIVPCEVKPLIG